MSSNDRQGPPPRDDDTPPSGDEARAQWVAPVMPFIWLAVGLLVIAAFVALLRFEHVGRSAGANRGPQPTAPFDAPLRQ